MRRSLWLLAAPLLCVGAAGAQSGSSPPPDYQPPGAQGLCPALADDYTFCSGDLWSGDCADFVAAAGRLGDLYRAEVGAHPDWADELRDTVWWGCGSADLRALVRLLERIDSAQARAVLAQEPYRGLAQPRPPAARPPPPPEQLDCEAPATQAERDACGARNVARAKSAHERAFAACREKVAPGLRSELASAEASWRETLPLECAGTDATRDECLVRAYEERTQSLAEMHRECAAVGSD